MSKGKKRLERCLSILRRLQQSPLEGDLLMEHVLADVDMHAYSGRDGAPSPRQFENDLKFLRETLEVELPGFDRTRGVYELEGFGNFNPLSLREEELDTFVFLQETFGPGAPHSDGVLGLLRRLQQLLPPGQRDMLLHRRRQLQMDVRQKDSDRIAPRVEGAIRRAQSRRCCLQFAYLSPGQSDGVPRVHTVQPWNRYFETTSGHYYLDAYRLKVEGPYGVWEKGTWQRYRLGRILDNEDLRVLPDRLPPQPPRRPVYPIEYRLAPEIARLGVTQHFPQTHLHPPDGDGWLRVTAETDDLFRACRLLLSYGPGCEVIGGRAARQEMEALVQGLGEVYKE